MKLSTLFRLDLRTLILLLAIGSALLTLLNVFYASYQAQHRLLLHSTLEANRVYATKLAEVTNHFFRTAWQQLAYSTGQVRDRLDDPARLQQATQDLLYQSDNFNAVAVVSKYGKILAAAPFEQHKALRLDTEGHKAILRRRAPLISQPYLSADNRLVVTLSYPLLDSAGEYQGYLGADIFLTEANVLNLLLGQHYYQDGSYLYVVDSEKHLIYHPDNTRLGEQIEGNPVIDSVLLGNSGEQRLLNSQGLDMLAGFAPVPLSGWGVVAQRPTAATLSELNAKMRGIFIGILPLTLLTLPCIWLLAALISRPLWQLARHAQHMDSPEVPQQIRRIRSWYFEARQLRQAMLKGIGLLHEKITQLNIDSLTDPMTGLLNRRGLQTMLDRLGDDTAFAVIALDIDHFKAINDSKGHAAGDEVIRFLARMMQENSRDSDILCRSGGEEFVMLLPEVTLAVASQVAERLRRHVAHSTPPFVDSLTISLGVTHHAARGPAVRQSLKIADAALYQAKQAGRNRVMVSPDGEHFKSVVS
ncbi:diguanylate cyclase [Zobellella taiwanensis]|uniref:diguanylate cyclase n=1 Tax=Zobellella taiwanensis TaxID=347535 RepID=A0A2P7QQ19_9GAMM|nr:sensor domain-containing diguanylate cyclase [Zobellella taiwanensis]PSJ40056.1 diguanylate cyclase [Zobellella taiwanensis]